MKVMSSYAKAVENIKDGQTIMVGGFGGHGSPHGLIEAIVEKGVKDLTIICNDAGNPNFGVGRFVREKMVKKIYASFISANPEALTDANEGIIEIELIPQGTLAEAIRVGGAGLGGVLTKAGVGTLVEEGKQIVEVQGEKYLLQEPLKADVSLVYASKGDTYGNLEYHGSTRAHSPSMATAGDHVIAEVDELVEVGGINPDYVHTQGVFIDKIIKKG